MKVSFDFYWVSDVPHRKFRVRLCIYILEVTLDALIGAGALLKANTVLCFMHVK